jgi:phosphatidylglycerol:prolipoprotein diacylglycerol transferase
MHPRLLTIPAFHLFQWSVGPLSIPTYGTLLAIAFLAGLWVVAREARRQGLDPQILTDLAVWALLGGLIGARILLVVVDWDYYWSNPREMWSLVRSGGVFYGGLVGGILVGIWYVLRHKLSVWRVADVTAPAIVLGQSIGRLGCLAAGCCWGKPTDVAWAVKFRDIQAARDLHTPVDIPLHPTQIYESMACAVIFLFLIWLAGRKKFHGQVALTYVILYSVARFIIEFYRGDAARGHVGPVSTSQFIALILVPVAFLLWPALSSKQRIEKAPAAPKHDAA